MNLYYRVLVLIFDRFPYPKLSTRIHNENFKSLLHRSNTHLYYKLDDHPLRIQLKSSNKYKTNKAKNVLFPIEF